MARPREFDIDEALETAMQAFWDHGYEGTSMADLVQAMGLKKGSIYKAFGNKHALFMAALERYLNRSSVMVSEATAKADSAIEALQSILFEMTRMSQSSEVRHGCFALNTVVELAAHDEQVEAYMAEGYKRMERKFTDLVRWGQESGDFRDDEDARVLARFVYISLAGLAAASKGFYSLSDIEEMGSFLIRNLQPSR